MTHRLVKVVDGEVTPIKRGEIIKGTSFINKNIPVMDYHFLRIETPPTNYEIGEIVVTHCDYTYERIMFMSVFPGYEIIEVDDE